MKATEIAIKENLGKRYKNQKGREFTLEKFICSEGEFFELVCTESGLIFTNEFHLSEIVSMEFEEVLCTEEKKINKGIKIKKIIEECEFAAPYHSCEECCCDERECMLFLLETYNKMEIDYEIEYKK
jgi:hypothetical protein